MKNKLLTGISVYPILIYAFLFAGLSEAGAFEFGASLVEPQELAIFKETNASLVWPSIPFEYADYFKTDKEEILKKFDQAIDLYSRNNIDIIARISTGSGWQGVIKDAPPYCIRPFSQPKDLRQYHKFVQELSLRYKGKIKYWQLLDEPATEWLQSPKDYILLLKETYRAIKETDTKARVLPGSISLDSFLAYQVRSLYLKGDYAGALKLTGIYYPGSVNTKEELAAICEKPRVTGCYEFLGYFFKQASPYYDIFSFHDYKNYASSADLIFLISSLKKQVNSSGKNNFLMLTSIADQPLASESLQAEALIKRFVIAGASGIKRILWWSFKDRPREDGIGLHSGLLDAASGPKTGYFYFKQIIEKLKNSTQICQLDLKDVLAFKIYNPKSAVYVIWSENGGKNINFRLNSDFAQVSFMENNNIVSTKFGLKSGILNVAVSSNPIFIEGRKSLCLKEAKV